MSSSVNLINELTNKTNLIFAIFPKSIQDFIGIQIRIDVVAIVHSVIRYIQSKREPEPDYRSGNRFTREN